MQDTNRHNRRLAVVVSVFRWHRGVLGVAGHDLPGVAMTLFSIVAACGVAAWIYSELFE